MPRPLNRHLVFLLPLLTAACATVAPAPAPAPQKTEAAVIQREPSSEDLRGASFYYLMLGELAGRRGQLVDAGQLYLEAARISRDPRAAERAARIALFARDAKTAEQAVALWTELEPASEERWQAEALLHLRAGRDAQAAELIDQHLPAGEERKNAYPQLIALLVQEGPNSVPVMQALAQRHPEESEAWFSLARLALHFKQFETSRVALNKVLRLEPRRKEAWTLLAGTWFSAGDIDAGLAQVKETIQRFPDDQELRLNYARALIEARRFEEARPLFDELLSKNPKDADLRYTVALLALDTRDHRTAERELRALLKTPERADAAAYYLGRLEEQRGNGKAAREWYGRVQAGEMRTDALIRLATLSAAEGRVDEARARLAAARAELDTPEERVRLFLAEADLLKKAGQPEAALKLLDGALIAHPGEPDLLYTRALLADRLDRFPEAEANLRAILAQDPEHPEALNALGFTLAERNIRLDEAYALIDKALKLSPDNPAFLDSMGWVLFRQGKAAEAEPFLRKAYAREPDGEIAAHLAEVLHALGRRDEALRLLDEALVREPGRPEVIEVQRRLR